MMINLEYSKHAFERCIERDINAISSLDTEDCIVSPQIKEGKRQVLVKYKDFVLVLVASNKIENGFLKVATVWKQK